MLNGVIDSRVIRREKLVATSQSLGISTHRTIAAESEVARLREEITRREAHYAEYIAQQQSFYVNHYATQITQQLQVNVNDFPFEAFHNVVYW